MDAVLVDALGATAMGEGMASANPSRWTEDPRGGGDGSLLLFSLLLLSALLADSVTWCAVGMLGCVMTDALSTVGS